jgi:hypothetical protein
VRVPHKIDVLLPELRAVRIDVTVTVIRTGGVAAHRSDAGVR